MVRQFEDLRIWQKARSLVSQCYDLMEIPALRHAWTFRNQFSGAALSIMNNIAEGFERDSDKQFIQFLRIAKGSAGEVRSMIYVMLDRNWISHEVFRGCRKDVMEVSAGIQSLSKYLRGTIFDETPGSETIREMAEWARTDLPESFFDTEQHN